MAVGDDAVAAVNRAVIQVEKALRLALANHVATVSIRTADFALLRLGRPRLGFQRLLAVRMAILVDRFIQCLQILQWLNFDFLHIELVLVRRSLQVRAIGVQDPAAYHPVRLRLFDDLLKNLLIDRATDKAPPAVLADSAGIRDLIRQAKAQKPPIGDIYLHFFDQLAFAADAVQVTNEQQLEQHHRINRRADIIDTVKVSNLVVDEIELNERVDLTQQVILRNQRLQGHHL